MINFEDGKIRCVALLYGPGKGGRGLIHEKPLRIILYSPQKKKKSLTELEMNTRQVYFRFNTGFLNFTLFFLHFFYVL